MDWKTVLAELKSLGYTQKAIADFCDCAQTTISDLATGSTLEPIHSTGSRILELRRRASRKRKAKAEPATQGA